MAILKVKNKPGDYRTANDVERAIRYMSDPQKVPSGGVFCGAVPLSCVADAMNCVTDAYHNQEGVHLRHMILSFAPEEGVSLEDVKEIAQKCISYYADEYQIFAAVHEDEPHLHIHLAMNTTSYVDGSKYPGSKKDLYGFKNHINSVVHPYGAWVRVAK